jgi:hypothetical protein
MPTSHREHAKWTPERMQQWAHKVGRSTELFIGSMIASRPFPEQAFRACLGVLRLGNQFGEDRLEKACEIAYNAGATRYKNVEQILKNKLDLAQESEPSNALVTPSHNNIRGSEYYQ